MMRQPPRSTLFPYTPLFRSVHGTRGQFRLKRMPSRGVPALTLCAILHRSEEHTSELQSHSFISYAVFCLNDAATTEIYALPLHAALPICAWNSRPIPAKANAIPRRSRVDAVRDFASYFARCFIRTPWSMEIGRAHV